MRPAACSYLRSLSVLLNGELSDSASFRRRFHAAGPFGACGPRDRRARVQLGGGGPEPYGREQIPSLLAFVGFIILLETVMFCSFYHYKFLENGELEKFITLLLMLVSFVHLQYTWVGGQVGG